MIEHFPFDDTSGLDALLASALATRVSWVQPFELTGARELHSPWSEKVEQVSSTPAPFAHALPETCPHLTGGVRQPSQASRQPA